MAGVAPDIRGTYQTQIPRHQGLLWPKRSALGYLIKILPTPFAVKFRVKNAVFCIINRRGVWQTLNFGSGRVPQVNETRYEPSGRMTMVRHHNPHHLTTVQLFEDLGLLAKRLRNQDESIRGFSVLKQKCEEGDEEWYQVWTVQWCAASFSSAPML